MISEQLQKKIKDSARYSNDFDKGFDEVRDGTIYTDEELVELCTDLIGKGLLASVNYLSYWLGDGNVMKHRQVEWLIQTQTLKPIHFDILFQPCEIALFVQSSIFTLCEKLDESYIHIGVSSPDAAVRSLAASHPCCPEAIRVTYHLTRRVQ